MPYYTGYCYDENKRFTTTISFTERPVYERQTVIREEWVENVTPEILCDYHDGILRGTIEPDPINPEKPLDKWQCPDCVMEIVDAGMVQISSEEDVLIGFEPDVPPNCTLEPCLYTAATWDGTKWIYDKDLLPPEPEPIPEPTPMEILRTELNATQEALAELILGK